MMKKIQRYRLRKCTDIDMELPFFEVLDENNIILFDLSKTDQGEYEILFYEGCSSRSIKIELLNKMIHEAKNRFLEEEE